MRLRYTAGMRIKLGLVLFTATLSAQTPSPLPPGPIGPPVQVFPPAIRLFLDLSDSQVQTIQRQNLELARFTAGKALRASQVQAEIGQETNRPNLDPLALGLRYTELEVIRREIESEQNHARERIRQALTEPQRARLRALEEILNLLPIYNEAAAVNLVERFGGGFARAGVPGGGFAGVIFPAAEPETAP